MRFPAYRVALIPAPLLRFEGRQEELGPGMLFIFHPGETLSNGTATDDDLYNAILLGTERICHG